MSPLRIVTVALVALFVMAAEAAERGYLGLSVAVDGEGAFWNPTLKTVKVTKVAPRSPAEQGGIVVGDHIVEIDGRQITGAKAQDLQSHMKKEAVQRVNLVVKKASGETRPVSIVAVPKRD